MQQSRFIFVPSLFALVASFMLLIPTANAHTSCTFKMFSPPSGLSGEFFPMGINHYNTVVGLASTATESSSKGYIRFSNGGVNLFTSAGATYTVRNKRNVNGTSVGQYGSTQTSTSFLLSGNHGFILTSKSFAKLDYPGAGATALTGVNKSNVIVGTALDTSTTGGFGFKYTNGTFTKIVFPHAVETFTFAINDNGVMVGGYVLDSFENPESGFILQNGNFKSLSYIPANINNSGTIVGGNEIHFANGTVKVVKVSGSDQVHVNGINDLGTITGAAHFPGTPGTWKGFLATCH